MDDALEDPDQDISNIDTADGDDLIAAHPAGATEKALQAIASARAEGDYTTVIALATPFEKRSGVSDVLEPGLVDIHVAAADALLHLGRADAAANKVHWIESVYGAQASLAFTAATIFRFQKDTDAALRAINSGICALSVGGRNQRHVELIALKAEILLERGERLQARALIAEGLRNFRAFSFFRILRRTITSREEVIEFENIVLPNLASYGADARNALYHYSYLMRELEDFDRAISIARERFFAVIKRYPIGSVPKKSGGSWVREAQVALADLQEDFKAAGLEFFLISGTLLGCVREKGILGHDKDIDVGVTEDISVATVYNAMKNSKRFAVRPIASEHSVYIEHTNGVKIDVFRHFMRDGRYYHEGPKVAWWNTPFNLVKTEFLGRTYLIPDNTDLYLTENYGTWRVPISDFETFVDTPNMEVRNSEYLIWYYFLNLADHFIWGKMGQFRRVWDALQKLYPVDAFLTATINDILTNEEKYRQMPEAMLARNIRSGALPFTDGEALPGLDASAGARPTHVTSVLEDVWRSLRRSPVTGDEVFLEAVSLYRLLLAKPNSPLLRWRFQRAAMIAGRAKMALGEYLEACQVWYSLRKVASNKNRANRNLVAAALKGARAKEAMNDKGAAFLLWRYLLEAQPDSKAAQQGLIRCAGA